MKAQLLEKNIVINGIFNPSELDKYFLIKNNFLAEDEFAKLRIPPTFSVFESNFETSNYRVNVYPNRMMTSSINLIDGHDNIEIFTSSLINAMKSHKISNYGINFDFVVDFENNEKLTKITRELFYPKDSTFFNTFFNESNVRLGTYVSKDVEKARLKLDIKPIKNIIKDLKQTDFNGLLLKFNYHFENNIEISEINNLKNYWAETIKIINFF